MKDEMISKKKFQPGDKFILEIGEKRMALDEYEIVGTDLWVWGSLLEKLTPYEPNHNVEVSNMVYRDTISRQTAIKALHDEIVRRRINEDSNDDGALDEFDTETILKQLPPAQPEQPTGVQDILQYLDKYLHPIVSPEHWSVYSELYDMVSMLPPAQLDNRLSKIAELVGGTIDHFDLDDAMDLLYQIKEIVGNETSNIRG